MVYADIYISLANSMKIKKDEQQTLSGVQIGTGRSNSGRATNRVLYYLKDGPDRAFVREELMHISEDTQAPPDWVSKWK